MACYLYSFCMSYVYYASQAMKNVMFVKQSISVESTVECLCITIYCAAIYSRGQQSIYMGEYLSHIVAKLIFSHVLPFLGQLFRSVLSFNHNQVIYLIIKYITNCPTFSVRHCCCCFLVLFCCTTDTGCWCQWWFHIHWKKRPWFWCFQSSITYKSGSGLIWKDWIFV